MATPIRKEWAESQPDKNSVTSKAAVERENWRYGDTNSKGMG